jgi:hypothetical protein
MAKYVVKEPAIDDDGNIAIPVDLYDSIPTKLANINVTVTATELLALDGLSEAERIAGYKALIEADPRVRQHLQAHEAYDLFTGDLTFPVEVED